jgi:hypothetical protein
VLRELYHKNDTFNLEDVEEFSDLSELVYQSELLQILGIPASNPEFDTEKLLEIYNKMKVHEDFLKCVEKVTELHSYTDLETGFIALFSYDYFFLTHKCICDFFNDENESIRQENLLALQGAITKNNIE